MSRVKTIPGQVGFRYSNIIIDADSLHCTKLVGVVAEDGSLNVMAQQSYLLKGDDLSSIMLEPVSGAEIVLPLISVLEHRISLVLATKQ